MLAIPLSYVLAALVLGVIPANRGWQEPPQGITIFVRSNGAHTWVMMPTSNAIMDWRPYAPAAHLRDRRYAGDYLAFGYGNRDFYLNTPTWWDLRPRTALAAAFGGGPALVHAEYEHDPRRDEWHRPLTISSEEYRRLAAFIRASFKTGADGRSRPVLGRGYGRADIFYEAGGRYDMFRTCNEWTGEALRAAGIRTGIWTPLERSIMWRLE